MIRPRPRGSRGGLAGLLILLATLALTWPSPTLPGPDQLLKTVRARERAACPPGPSPAPSPGR